MLTIQSRSSFFDRALLQAMLWSLVVHLVLFATFRIRYNSFLDSALPIAPIAVALDADDTAPQMSAIAEAEAQNTTQLFTESLDDDEWRASCLNRLQSPSQNPPTSKVSHNLSALGPAELAQLQPRVDYAPKIYPLELKLSRSLKALCLAEDGSSLFRTKGPHDDLGRYVLNSQRYPIEYKIKVDGATGRIVRGKRTYELLDKALQKVADLLITKIRFAPFAKKSLKGSLTMSFCCSGEEMRELLND